MDYNVRVIFYFGINSETIFWRTRLVTPIRLPTNDKRFKYRRLYFSRLRCLPRQRYPSSSIDLTTFQDSTHGHDFNQGHSRVVMTRKTERRIFVAPSKLGQVRVIRLLSTSISVRKYSRVIDSNVIYDLNET